MSNIRARIEFVKEVVDRLVTEKLGYAEAKDLVRRAKEEVRMIEIPLKYGDVNGPICCFTVTKNQGDVEMGCGRWTDERRDEWVWNFYGPTDEFVRYCKTCRSSIIKELPNLRKKLDDITKMYNI